MKWLSEKENLEALINEGVSYEEMGRMYNVSGSAVKKAALRLGIQLPRRRRINPSETFKRGTAKTALCKNCGREFVVYLSSSGLFCCRECHQEYRSAKIIEEWKSGIRSGTCSFTCTNYVRNYMLRKTNYKCEKCGWGETNPATGKIPLQIHHIDGNSLNNKEENLQVLCPNCHSLTDNFGSRNVNAPNGKSHYYRRAH